MLTRTLLAGVALVAAVAVLASEVGASAPPARDGRAMIGTNLSGISPLSTQWDFADQMKGSNVWIVPNGAPLALDANGWPTAIPAGNTSIGASVRLFIDGNRPRLPDYPAGDYLVTWEGSGRFSLSIDGSATIQANGPGQRPVGINPGQTPGGVWLGITQIDASDPLRNIRIYAPGHGPGQPDQSTFQRPFREMVGAFGTTRYMDWMRANDNPVVAWNDRARVGDRTYATHRGVPVEHLVSLSNEARTNPWFTMPVRADDNYIRQFATHVRDNLDPNLKIYVEYGNEVWGFPLAQQHLRGMVPAGQNPNIEWPRMWAQEARRTFDIWHDVFGEDRDRIVRVAAAQAENRWASPRFYDYLEGNFDAISIAAYVGGTPAHYNASTTPDQIIDDLLLAIAMAADTRRRTDTENTSNPNRDGYLLGTNQPVGGWAYHKQIADLFSTQLNRHIPLIAYEGGQHVVPPGPDASWYDAYVAAQRHERMYDVYMTLLDTWFNQVGAAEFVNFSSVAPISQWGAWGALEHQMQPLEEAHKMRALRDFMATIPEPGTALFLPLVGLLLARRPDRRGQGRAARPLHRVAS